MKRESWEAFWLVDPLDGTKEFIKRNGEFTVNIALMVQNRPVAGVIFAPDLDLLYYGQKGDGAIKADKNGKSQRINVAENSGKALIVVRSRSHSSQAEEDFFSQYTISETIEIGSSLKFCMVAEGKAHIYYRHGPTWEWDTAAGHAIVEAAGGQMSGNGASFEYNKKSLLIGSFVVKSF